VRADLPTPPRESYIVKEVGMRNEGIIASKGSLGPTIVKFQSIQNLGSVHDIRYPLNYAR
jgi:hypothetical protein